jgi:hypothetical protein
MSYDVLNSPSLKGWIFAKQKDGVVIIQKKNHLNTIEVVYMMRKSQLLN